MLWVSDNFFNNILNLYLESTSLKYQIRSDQSLSRVRLFFHQFVFWCFVPLNLFEDSSTLSLISVSKVLNCIKKKGIVGSIYIRSDQISHSVVSDCLWPHELQHARPPSPSPTSRVHSNSCPSSWWCHPAISSSVFPFSTCPQFPQHQSLFQWVNSLHEVVKVLEFQL